MPLALVAEPVSLPAGSQLRLIVLDRLGEGPPQGVQVGLLGEGQLVPQVGIDLNRLAKQLGSPALRLDPP